MKKIAALSIGILMLGLLLPRRILPALAKIQGTVTVPASPVAEGKDYATQVLGDPWDMSEYSDISQYLNQSGEVDVVQNVGVNNGIFSATSSGDVSQGRNGWFFTVFPGYQTAIHTGRSGSKAPIDSGQYQCFYIAMKVDSPAANQFGPDQYRVFWFADDRLNGSGAPYGFTNGIPLYPEYNYDPPVPIWKLYSIDLPVQGYQQTAWTDQSQWQGFRIDPTINAGVNYAVDWVRLTDCSPRTVTVTFTPNAAISAVWLRPAGETRRIRIATDVTGSSGSYVLDVQGVQPGSYYVGFGDGRSCCTEESTGLLTINQTPVVTFRSPTFYSGEDFATTAGNAWDMSSPNDYSGIRCAQYGQGDGFLWFRTPPESQQPPECSGQATGAVSDPFVYLDVPQPIAPAEYRYLSFRFYDNNPWQFVPKGSIVRWVWTVQGDSGRPGYECHLVSQDMPFDVGSHIYTIDLWDAFEGSAEQWQGECTSLPKNWQNSSPVLAVRFDPNENITDHEFYNEIDWIRLTRPIVVQQGERYRISLDTFFPGDTFNVSLYYTSDPQNQPAQHSVVLYTPPAPPSPGPNDVYLPVVMNITDSFNVPGDLNYLWDTTSVFPGTYYICALTDDGLNQATFCSEAPVIVQ
ncbi:MAG: hypothetical protein D6681_15165 [Calditrichaeota bacterium]|nr:MAG: hypothetical protein D6681_15165 [Calditrichota bacterium]